MKSETLIALGVVIVLLFLACALVSAVVYFIAQGNQQSAPSTPAQNQPPVPVESNSTPPATQTQNASPGELTIWNEINQSSVETQCLAQAKKKAGSNAGLVYSCSCSEVASADRKTYSCDIATGDPFTKYFADIDCFLASSTCLVTTNYGTQNVTFSQLQNMGG